MILAYTRWVSICAQAPLYRQREFHQSPLWRILVDHGEEFLRTYDSRYEETHGPLPLQSARVMEKLLRCGDPRYGLTLLHCPDCQVHMAVPFSCKTRVCPSCINRRAEVLSHTLAEKLPEGDYRHLVVTLPKHPLASPDRTCGPPRHHSLDGQTNWMPS